MTVRILIGDVRARLAELPTDSVDCVVTSPPYWGLRDYGVAGQIGMEATLWLNYGDCYATKPNGRSAEATKAAGNDDRTFRDKPFSTVPIPARGHRTQAEVRELRRVAARWRAIEVSYGRAR